MVDRREPEVTIRGRPLEAADVTVIRTALNFFREYLDRSVYERHEAEGRKADRETDRRARSILERMR